MSYSIPWGFMSHYKFLFSIFAYQFPSSQSTAALGRVEGRASVKVPFSGWVSQGLPKSIGIRSDSVLCVQLYMESIDGRR